MTIGFNLINRDKRLLLSNNLFSVPCILSNGTDIQGKNSLLPTDNIDYDATDTLRCIGNFIGIQTNGSGVSTINDSCEATLNSDDIKIGRPSSSWTLSFLQGGTNQIMDFKIDYVMEDKTIGVYRIKLSLLKKEQDPNNKTNNETNTTIKTNNSVIIRKNGGI